MSGYRKLIPKGDPGDSAYEVAIKEGFVGTKEEWLESLKGEKGDPGDGGVVSVNQKQPDGLGNVDVDKDDVGLGKLDNVKQASDDDFNEHLESEFPHKTTDGGYLWNARVNQDDSITFIFEEVD